MTDEITKRGLPVVRQQTIPIIYDSIHLEAGFRADLIVEDKPWAPSTSANSSPTSNSPTNA